MATPFIEGIALSFTADVISLTHFETFLSQSKPFLDTTTDSCSEKHLFKNMRTITTRDVIALVLFFIVACLISFTLLSPENGSIIWTAIAAFITGIFFAIVAYMGLVASDETVRFRMNFFDCVQIIAPTLVCVARIVFSVLSETADTAANVARDLFAYAFVVYCCCAGIQLLFLCFECSGIITDAQLDDRRGPARRDILTVLRRDILARNPSNEPIARIGFAVASLFRHATFIFGLYYAWQLVNTADAESFTQWLSVFTAPVVWLTGYLLAGLKFVWTKGDLQKAVILHWIGIVTFSLFLLLIAPFCLSTINWTDGKSIGATDVSSLLYFPLFASLFVVAQRVAGQYYDTASYIAVEEEDQPTLSRA